MTPSAEEELDSYAGKVYLNAATGAPDSQDICAEGYEVEIKRRDGLPMSQMEVRSVITNLPWVAIDNKKKRIYTD